MTFPTHRGRRHRRELLGLSVGTSLPIVSASSDVYLTRYRPALIRPALDACRVSDISRTKWPATGPRASGKPVVSRLECVRTLSYIIWDWAEMRTTARTINTF